MKPFGAGLLCDLRDSLQTLEKVTWQLALSHEFNNLDSAAIKHLRKKRKDWRVMAQLTQESIRIALEAEAEEEEEELRK